ncbi:ATP-dependent helicase ULS1 [Physcia stellaris]|nr:ATP-dependent helicase ULS1 [Physcia stellaris]
MDKWYEFGLNMDIAHQPPIWRNPYYLLSPENTRPMIRGESWCMNTSDWNALTKPIRRLGLLLLEIALGTSVSNTRNDANGAVTHVFLFLRGTPPRFFRKKPIRLEKALALVAKAVHGSDGFSNAIRCCLTRTLDQMPFDDEWEDLLKDLYFDIVKPLKDLYDIRLTTFPVRRHPARTSELAHRRKPTDVKRKGSVHSKAQIQPMIFRPTRHAWHTTPPQNAKYPSLPDARPKTPSEGPHKAEPTVGEPTDVITDNRASPQSRMEPTEGTDQAEGIPT